MIALASLRIAGHAAPDSALQIIVYGVGLAALASVFALIRQATGDGGSDGRKGGQSDT